jgi:hypothetical protein
MTPDLQLSELFFPYGVVAALLAAFVLWMALRVVVGCLRQVVVALLVAAVAAAVFLTAAQLLWP